MAPGGSPRGNSDGTLMKCPRKLLAVSVAICLALWLAIAASRAQRGVRPGRRPASRCVLRTTQRSPRPYPYDGVPGGRACHGQGQRGRAGDRSRSKTISAFLKTASSSRSRCFPRMRFRLSAAILIDDDLKTGHGGKGPEDAGDTGRRVQRFRRSVPVALRRSARADLRGFHRRQRHASHAAQAHRPQQFVSRHRLRTR